MKDLLDIILDENNTAPIVLTFGDGKNLAFEQIAVIPYEIDDIKNLYVILKPIDKVAGIKDDEAIVFLVDTDDGGNSVLRVEEDQKIATAIFEIYSKMLQQDE